MNKVWIGIATAIAVLTLLPEEAQAVGVQYSATCEFKDRGEFSGGDVSASPCNFWEFVNPIYYGWKITWSDGVETIQSINTQTRVVTGNFILDPSPGKFGSTQSRSYETLEGDTIRVTNIKPR